MFIHTMTMFSRNGVAGSKHPERMQLQLQLRQRLCYTKLLGYTV